MRQFFEGVSALGLDRCLTLCVALSVGLLSASCGAALQNPSPPKVPVLEGQNPGANSSDQHSGAPTLRAAHGDESRNIPKTFVEMTPAELADAVPELTNLKPADSQEALPQILKGVGGAVAAFFANFPNTACTEQVISDVHRVSLKGALHFNHKYNYLALPEGGSEKGRLREYRTNAKGDLVQPEGIVTFGFVALAVHFHPDYQADSSFRYLGREEMENQDTYVVAFAQRPNVARLRASVQFLGQTGIVYLQGVAWIDPVSFRIVRLRTDIQQPNPDVNLQQETVQVFYSEVNFAHRDVTLWLPREVTVTGQLKEYLFHNLHRYSDYQLFTVQAEEKQNKP